MSIEDKRQELLEHAGIVSYDSYGVFAIMALADAYVLEMLEECYKQVHQQGFPDFPALRERLYNLGATE